MEIAGTAAVVTGGASGLGLATASLLRERGAKVAILDLQDASAAAASIGALALPVDITDDSAVERALSLAQAKHGIARILVNCAGIGPGERTVRRDGTPHAVALFSRVISVNLIASFNMAAQFAARLGAAEPLGEERGVIVHTSSIAAFEGQVGQVAYAASKAGLVGLTLPMARDLASVAIRVVTLAPGIFATPMFATLPQDVQTALTSQVPFPNRAGSPAEFAAFVETVIRSPMLNGEVIRLDGAVRMGAR